MKNIHNIYNNLIKRARDYFKKSRLSKAVIGVSGGIDSALSLRLIVDAIGNNNVTGLIMPEKNITRKEDINDAIGFCKSLNVKYKIIEINPILNQFKKIKIKQNKNSWINLKPRIRMVILYNYANANNALVVGTSNKTELRLGYFTKYGDGACDFEIIGDLYKTEVLELARYLKLPSNIINKKPSAGLFKGQSDEKEIGETYRKIDDMLKGKIKMSERIKKLIEKNKHKTAKIYVIKK